VTALQWNNAHYHQLAADLHIGIVVQLATSEIVLANVRALELLGLTRAQLLGLTSFDPSWNVIHPDGAPFPGSVHPVPLAIATRQPVHNVEMGVWRPTTEDRVWLLVNADPEFADDGSVTQVVCTFTDLTAHKQAQDHLTQSILDSVVSEIAVVSHDGTILAVNQPWLRFAAANRSPSGELPRLTQVGANYLSAFHPGTTIDDDPDQQDAIASDRGIRDVMDGRLPSYAQEYPCHSPTEQRWFSMEVTPLVGVASGGVVITHTNITERKLAELAQSEASTVFACSYEAIMVVSPDLRITKVNPAFTRITGYSAEEAVGKTPQLLASGRHDAAFYQSIWSAIRDSDFWSGEVWDRRKDGEIYASRTSISSVRAKTGSLQHYVAVFSDVSKFKAHEAELERAAYYDPLTGAPNRRMLADRLDHAIQHSTRTGRSLAVCFVDLDNFKTINEVQGHAAGDQVLVAVTDNLKRVLRGDDTLARIGGDEFVLLLSDIGSPEECSQILERVLLGVSAPVHLGNASVSVAASIGVSLYPQDNADADTLLRHADQAMYKAKEAGKNRYCLFDLESNQKAQTHRSFLEALREALAGEQFELFYQPLVDLRDGCIVGAEALLRWRSPQRGLVEPADFLHHMAGSDLETPVGDWVIRTALAQAAQWRQLGLALCINVNISAHHLLEASFHLRLAEALAAEPTLPPECFKLEVLETAAIADINLAVNILVECRKLGVHFALDDFGTGYSSLTYLRKLPVDTLKIDQSFVRDMLVDSDDKGIVEGVIRLGEAFRKTIVAEGVETLEHGVALLSMCCTLAQGYGIARPMPASQFMDWCANWRSEQRWLTWSPVRA
jgi:diguanylate cyclase (GGDEF)-like protein/PAS domain S-box-containing protein